MRMKFAAFVIFCNLFVSPADSLPSPSYHWSVSIADSKKLHRFVSPVTVIPESFDLLGHKIDIVEAWRERVGEADKLCWRLKVDDDARGEVRNFYDKGPLIYFQRQDDASFNRGVNYFVMHKWGSRIGIVHYVLFDREVPNFLTFKLGTRWTQPTMTDRIVRFEWRND